VPAARLDPGAAAGDALVGVVAGEFAGVHAGVDLPLRLRRRARRLGECGSGCEKNQGADASNRNHVAS
jgi:hypothetical protein